MNNQEKIKKAFDTIKVPDDIEFNIRANKSNSNRFVSLFITTAVLVVMGGSAYAIGKINNFRISFRILSNDSNTVIEENREEGNSINGFHISYPFGASHQNINGKESIHEGIDFTAEEGTEVLSVANGVIKEIGYDAPRGNYVIIEHEEGYTTIYEHLKESIVNEGNNINEGDKIGYVGKTGMCTGPCLHFELKYNGTSVNPADYFEE